MRRKNAAAVVAARGGTAAAAARGGTAVAAARGGTAAAAAPGGTAAAAANEAQYTFMGYDHRSTCRLPHGWGDQIPCVFTHKSGVDMEIIGDIRPLFNMGVRPEMYSSRLLELQTKEHARSHLLREHEIKRKRMSAAPRYEVPALFGEFGDKKGYAGLVPTGAYIEHVYKRYMKSIIQHLDNEVKKRGAERLHWDVSYKEPAHLGRYHSETVYKGLVTALNDIGEVSTACAHVCVWCSMR